jgi:hypothetical protein
MANTTLPDIEQVAVGKLTIEKMIEYQESIKLTASAVQGDRYQIYFSSKSEEGSKQ